uniref:Protein kinase domain-containing protein n=1 Tax=Knipowitschia caucasica TaxID=637954 RepID=A0AAV2LYW7_KNICA
MASGSDPAVPLTVDKMTTSHALQGTGSTYTVVEFTGQGMLAKVAKYLNIQTKTMVAVKILMDPYAIKEADKEILPQGPDLSGF